MRNRLVIILALLAEAKLVSTPVVAKSSTIDAAQKAAVEVVKNAIEQKLARAPAGEAYEVAFAPFPNRQAERLVQKIIDTSETSVDVAAFEFTSKPIADALCAAARRGASVRVVLDARVNTPDDPKSKWDYLVGCRVSVRLNEHYQTMHDKFIVVDGRHVETGSFNFTFAAAERNAENVLVLWNAPELAAHYHGEFERLFAEASP